MLSGAKFGGAYINPVEEVEEENFESNDPNAVTLNSVANQTAKANDGIPKGEKVLTDLSKSKKEIVVAKFNDLDKLITLLQSQPDDDGFYIYLGPQRNGSNDPYDLEPLIKEEEKKDKNPEKFFTLSKKGITTYISDEPVEYITLTDWLIERNFYQRISNLNFFK